MKALKIGELTARIPVIQGGMGVGISLSGLAGSVAACGGVGVISTAQIGYRDPEFEKDPIKTNLRVIGEEIQKARGHLGFSRKQLEEFTPVTYDQEIRGILAEVKKYADKYGKEIPVVVAGGIFTREDMLHAMELGADGVQMGTRFVTTWECDASEAYKQTYLHAKKEDIVIVDSPVGMPGRAIRNRFLEEKESRRELIKKCYQCIATCNPANTPYCITRALVHAAKGETDDALLFCGENAWRCEKMEHVADIMAEFA